MTLRTKMTETKNIFKVKYDCTVKLDFKNRQDKNRLDFKNQITNDQLLKYGFKKHQYNYKSKNGFEKKLS